jgi:uncharacterized protein involved in outer membrane biogenesis
VLERSDPPNRTIREALRGRGPDMRPAPCLTEVGPIQAHTPMMASPKSAKTRSGARLPHWLIGIAGVALALVLVVVFFPWNVLRGPLESYLSAQTGRTVRIHGDLSVKFAWHPWVDIGAISVANADWSDLPIMFYVDHVGMRVAPLSFFTRLHIPELRLDSPRLILEKSKEGHRNWVTSDEPIVLPLVGQVWVADGWTRYRDPRVRADIAVHHLTQAQQGNPDALAFAGFGMLNGQRFRIAGQGEGLGALREVAQPFDLTFHMKSGATDAWFDGTVVPNDPENVRGFLKVAGPDMAQLYPLLPTAIPWTPPYRVAGRLAHHPGRWVVTELSGKMGQSDMAGTVTIETDRPRQKVVADLSSQRLDYRDLGGLIGLPPGKTNSVQQDPKAAAVGDRVLSPLPFKLDRLREYDAELHFRGKSIRVDRVPMDNVDLRLVIDNGVLRYDPVKLGIASGQLTVTGTLDANKEMPHLDARLEGRNLDLARIFPELASPRGRAGRFGGYLKVRGSGDSVARIAANAHGEGALVMSGGEASALALLLTNLDLAGAVPLILAGDKTAALHCAVTSYAIEDGTVKPHLLVVDTSAVRIDGDGTIDLDNEVPAITLRAKSKKFSIFALRGPIVIGGTLKHPTVGPTVAPIAARVGVAAGLASVSPPLAILPFIDPGGAPDVDCRGLLNGKAAVAQN